MDTIQARKAAPIRVVQLTAAEILPNPAQPRKYFEPKALEELAESIAQCGVIQPLTVRRLNGRYVLVTGERRLRASRIAGLRQVPCIITDVDDETSAAIALVENLHRKDLTFLEEAEGLQALILQCGLSRQEAARRVGKSQSAVANKLRLLTLSPEILQTLLANDLSERHARALLRLEGETLQKKALSAIIREGMTVARTEEYIDALLRSPQETPPARNGKATYVVKDVRLFLNSVGRSMDLMRQAGIHAVCGKEETEDSLILTIRIPKALRKRG
ncbi:MAG: ParB/RepB/Spo0J family partition protein [Oscillospiraceae bacterium]|nr:ParB/RepB/Spo0J family partition protein [Oscillospiraceae bacterium]